jgi:hypothetical protein
MHNVKNITLRIIVIRKRVFSIPLRAVKTPPVSAPVNPPNPAPLLCKITAKISAIDVIINAMNRKLATNSSCPVYLYFVYIYISFKQGGLYLSLLE